MAMKRSLGTKEFIVVEVRSLMFACKKLFKRCWCENQKDFAKENSKKQVQLRIGNLTVITFQQNL